MAKVYHANIAKDTQSNTNFRKVVATEDDLQLVLMSLKPGEDIGMETHDDIDQFIRVDDGSGYALIGGNRYELSDDSAVIVPKGTRHNIVAGDKGLKLYTVYSKQNHPDGAVFKTKEEADRMEKAVVVMSAVDFELSKAEKGASKYINKDKTFKGGFEGCVAYQKSKGLSEKSARKLCAYIGRRAGKIK